MSQPVRWKDSTSAPVGMRELFGAAERTPRLADSVKRRGAKKLLVAAPPAAAAATVSLWLKLAAAAVIATGTATAVVTRLERPAATARPPAQVAAKRAAVRAGADVAPAALEPASDAAPATEPAVTAVAAPPRLRAIPQPRASEASADVPLPAPPARETSTLEAELALVRGARAVVTTEPMRALAMLDEHARRYPDGVLARERDLVRLDALRRASRGDEARALADAWLIREPNGLFSARVRALRDTTR